MSIKFNNADAIYGGFENVTPPARRNRNSDNDAAIGAAMIIGGLLGAAAVAAAADEDYTSRRAEEIRREAERAAARREAERRADEIRREAERAARRALCGLTNDEVVHEVVKFCMKEQLSNKMVVMTAIVREMFAQGATINSAEAEFGDLKIKGHCADGNDLKIILNSIGGITIYAYDGKLVRYSSSNKVFKEYELLVKEYNKPNFNKLARVMSY
jgi:hypothetical protein